MINDHVTKPFCKTLELLEQKQIPPPYRPRYDHVTQPFFKTVIILQEFCKFILKSIPRRLLRYIFIRKAIKVLVRYN